MQIHQLSVVYQSEQDRLLMRVNTRVGTELSLWITRRLLRRLGPLLIQVIDSHVQPMQPGGDQRPDVRRAVADMERDALLQGADFATPYQPVQARPLGDEPLLVSEVVATPLASVRLRLSFLEKIEGRPLRSFDIDADASLLQALLHLIRQALAQSQWQEPFGDALSEQAAIAAAAEARPRYLN